MNIILFLYQFEFIGGGDTGITLSVFRLGIMPLLFVLLLLQRNKAFAIDPKDTPAILVILFFFVSYAISSLQLAPPPFTSIFGCLLQFWTAYIFFREFGIQKSSLWVLTTWSLFQLPYFLIAISTGEVGLSHRFMGFHWDPNYLCMTVTISFWAAIYLLRLETSKFRRLFLLGLAIASVLMVLFSLSRGGLFCLILTSLLYLFFNNKKVLIVLGALSFSLFSYMIARAQYITWDADLSLLDSIIYRNFVIAEDGDISSGRLDFISTFLTMIGNGEGIVYGKTLPKFINDLNGGEFPHNALIEVILHSGLIAGGIFFLLFLKKIATITLASLRNRSLPFELLMIITTILVMMFLSWGLKFCWLIVGLTFAISNKSVFKNHYSKI